MVRRLSCLGMLAGLGMMAGCASNAIKETRTTFLSSDDLVAMTSKMATELASSNKVAQIQGLLTIVIKPVINETNEIIRDNRAEMFVARVQSLLASQPGLHDRYVWVINREDFEKLRREEVTNVGPSEDATVNGQRIVPEYCLYAKFQVDTHITDKGRSDAYLCTYFLTRINGPANVGEAVWSGEYETQKTEKKGFLD